jgi:ATP/maltotriose-dependent transcriptional regulator MalT
MAMNNLFDIIKNRSAPGILIFDMNNKLLYSNNEALAMIPGLLQTTDAVKDEKQQVPEEIYDLCNIVRREATEKKPPSAENPNCTILHGKEGFIYSLRAFCMGFQSINKNPTHIMVLLEKVVEKHRVDYEKVKIKFKLTKRETDVLIFICEGLTNKEISSELSICEYTVKDHIKKIMRKMDVGSRSEIISVSF